VIRLPSKATRQSPALQLTPRNRRKRAYARTIMQATKKMTDLPLVGLSTKSYEDLKTEQRQLFARVSDEALSDWDHLRLKIRNKAPR
jgi:hypothetical protein